MCWGFSEVEKKHFQNLKSNVSLKLKKKEKKFGCWRHRIPFCTFIKTKCQAFIMPTFPHLKKKQMQMLVIRSSFSLYQLNKRTNALNLVIEPCKRPK